MTTKTNHSAADYQYDVFISWSHDSVIERWLNERFLPLFEHHLSDELGGKVVPPYVAKNHLAGGTRWPDELAIRHAGSRVLLALLSRPYRNSPWCQREFSMMRAREEMEKIRERTTRSLIVPVFIHDGDDVEYKILLNGIQPFNLVHPDRLVSPFMAEKCEDAKRLDDRIFEIASAVGNAILAAPKYNAAWCKLNCDAFLQLFTQYQGSRSQTVVPGRE